jgi:hypothetical protein
MLRKIFVIFILLLCLAGLAFYLLTWPPFLTRLVKEVVNQKNTDWIIQDFTIDRINVDKKGLVNVNDVHFTIQHTDQKADSKKVEVWQGQIEAVQLDNLNTFWGPERMVTVSVTNANAQTETINVQGADVQVIVKLQADRKRRTVVEGNLHIDTVASAGGELTLVEAAFHGNEDKVVVDPWRGNWAGGLLAGKLTLAKDEYTIHADVLQVDLSQLEEINEPVLGGMRGRLDGTLDLSADAQQIHSLKGYFAAPVGAEVRAALLKPIVAYIPASQQKDILVALITQNTNIFLDQADINLQSSQSEMITFHTHLASTKLNLNMTVTIDVNVEGGLKNLTNHISHLLTP